jgi:hypothetical protein
MPERRLIRRMISGAVAWAARVKAGMLGAATSVLCSSACTVADPERRCYLRMLTARATTRIPTTREIASSVIIMSLAHGLIAETSVGLNAIAALKERCR